MTATQVTTPITFVEIPGCEGYDAGSDGHVYSRRTQFITGLCEDRSQLAEKTDKDGYREVTIYFGQGRRRSFKVHALVLLAFKGPCPEGSMACHYPDADRTNNRPGNLMWGTNSLNQLHRREQGTAHGRSKNTKAKLSDEDVATIRKRYDAGGVTQAQLALEFGVYQSTIGRIVRGDTWCEDRDRTGYRCRSGPPRVRAKLVLSIPRPLDEG